MTNKCTLSSIRERVVAVVLMELGQAEEDLVGTGLIDSVKAVSVALSLEQEFGISFDDLSLTDMATLSSLSEKIHAVTSHHINSK